MSGDACDSSKVNLKMLRDLLPSETFVFFSYGVVNKMATKSVVEFKSAIMLELNSTQGLEFQFT